MNKGKNRQETGGPESALGPGVPAPDFNLGSTQTIRWSYLSPLDVNPGADGILDALEALDSKLEVAA